MSAADLPLIKRRLASPYPAIGESDTIGRVHGSAFIRTFVNDRLRNGAARMVTDPDPANKRAIRAFENAGFVSDRLVDTPDGIALLMVRDA